MKDNFFDIIKEIQNDIPAKKAVGNRLRKDSEATNVSSPMQALKMPEYDPKKQYDSEFYNLFI